MRYYNFNLLLMILILFPSALYAFERNETFLQDTTLFVSPFKEDNERCFKCHAEKKYEYMNETSGKLLKAAMHPGDILSRDKFYASNHKGFSCTDCHSSQFQSFPHNEELKKEPHFTCLDCHGDDAASAIFKFEEIDREFRKSVHYRLEEKGFNCWECHDPHSYRLNFRNSKDMKKTVLYDNSICLDCHADYDRFKQFSDDEKIKLSRVHKWLPHQTTHFESVRCIDCHTKVNENILVPHYVMPKEAATRDCRKCHNGNAETMASLLTINNSDMSHRKFNNDVIINGLNIIGANRNKYLDNIILMVFTGIMTIIGIHIFFRIIRK
jgi:hypothetical protein